MRRLITFLLRFFAAGQGRPAAAVLLMVFIILQFYPDRYPLEPLRLALFDAYQTHFPRERKSAPATIVHIDEASLKRFGQWPWPRTRLAALIGRISTYKPSAIGLDIIMPEPDRSSPGRIAESLPQIGSALRRQLAALPDNDRILAAQLKEAPVVLGLAGVEGETTGASASVRTAPMLVKGGDPLPYLRRFSAALKSVAELEGAASGQAILNADIERGIVRRIPLVAAVGETLVPSLSLELLRVAAGLPAVEVHVGSRGIASVGIGDVHIPTQANGEAWVHLSPFLPERYVSAVDVFDGKVNPELLQHKLVLVGLTGLGLVDYFTTARGERVPGMEMHVQFLENIFDQHFLLRPTWMTWLELAVLSLSGLYLLLTVPVHKPRLSTLVTLFFTILLLAGGLAFYRISGLLFDAASLAVGINTVFASLSFSTFIETDRQRRIAQQQLQMEREAAARIAGELEAARRIQMGSLPNPSTAFPGERRFELDALLKPARQVGGDLYDFYMLDENRLFFIIGDVSGKGLPACLFMAMTKTLAKSIVLSGMADVRTTLSRVNRELARENPEMLFVTAFAAIVDAESGVIEYCIAGHDAPWLITARGVVNQLDGEGNLPLCVREEQDYPLLRLQLSAGDTICVVTDGITEAMNTGKELYGKTQLNRLLGKNASSLSPSRLIALVHDDVHAFAGGAEQSDDLALLVMRWNGPKDA